MVGQPEHRKLKVYESALDVAARLHHVAVGVRAERADLADQLQRASASIPLNIAEGTGEYRPREKARFYRIARRSAAECSAILELIHRIFPGTPEVEAANRSLYEVMAMLSGMVKAVEAREG